MAAQSWPVLTCTPFSECQRNSTSLAAKYESVAKQMVADYPYHGMANNSTQYYSTKSGVNTYFVGIGGLAGSYVDTNPYPASACSDTQDIHCLHFDR